MMVLAEVTQDWQRALARAEARNISATLSGESAEGDVLTRWYHAGSWSRNGLEHGVQLVVDANGVQVHCSRESGTSGQQHAAMALKLAGQLGDRPQVAPAPVVMEEEVKRLQRRRAMHLLNGEFEEVDAIDEQLTRLGAA